MAGQLKNINISRVLLSDLKTLYEIDRLCFDKNTAFSLEYFYYIYNTPDTLSYKFVIQDRIIGFIIAWKKSDVFYEILTIDILKDYRGRGYGKALLKFMEERMIENGAFYCMLQVSQENETALKFYLKYGYVKKAFLHDYYGINRHAFLMVKDF